MSEQRMKWFSPVTAPFELEGMAFFDRDRVYRRLPLNPDSPMPAEVERLSWNTAGVKLRFRAKLKKLAVRVRVTEAHVCDHLTAMAKCGFDCYADDGTGMRFCAAGRFDRSLTEYESVFFDFDRPHELEIVVNFPLYSGVSDVLFGFDWDAEISAPSRRSYGRRIVAYGTSITQGGCASRPGMAYTNILSRRLDAEIINLGFSGSGRAEEEVAREIAKIDNVGMFIIDCEENCHLPEVISERYPVFLRILRESDPGVPILLLTASRKAYERFNETESGYRAENKRIQRELAETLRKNGDGDVYFLDYDDIRGESWMDETVDGVHATDLGFINLANGLEPVIRGILKI